MESDKDLMPPPMPRRNLTNVRINMHLNDVLKEGTDQYKWTIECWRKERDRANGNPIPIQRITYLLMEFESLIRKYEPVLREMFRTLKEQQKDKFQTLDILSIKFLVKQYLPKFEKMMTRSYEHMQQFEKKRIQAGLYPRKFEVPVDFGRDFISDPLPRHFINLLKETRLKNRK